MNRASLCTAAFVFAVLAFFQSPALAGGLSFEERVKAQKAIEQVYWSHRIWPAEIPRQKPPLEAVMPDSAIRAKVEDYVRKSNALDVIWGRPITTAQLQAELARMTSQSRDPQLLQEIFAALGNDPHLIAETIARQALADRLVRNAYAYDDRFHGEQRATAGAALAGCDNVACMRTMGGTYRETTWKRRTTHAGEASPDRVGKAAPVDAEEWVRFRARLATKVGESPDSLPLNTLGPLEETAEAFVVTAVLAVAESEVTTAVTTWEKAPFDRWWAEESATLEATIDAVEGEFTLGALSRSSCTPDTWTATRFEVPEPVADHTAVWTGTEMIVWGGNPATNIGGRYSPATDTWVLTSTGTNVPAARSRHTAVWTGTEMIVWGGSPATNTGGRYNPLTDTWVATSTGANVPSPRDSHTAVWTGTEMIVWGGNPATDTGGRYNPSTNTWVATPTGGRAPTGRADHTAVWTGTEMIVWGGYSNQYLNNGGRYNPATDRWATVSTGTNVPSPRRYHSAVWTGTAMVIWGGYYFDGIDELWLNTGGRYDPAANTWAATSTGANVPSPRSSHTALWTGTEMLVWAGAGPGFFPLATGGRYNPATDAWTATSTGGTVPRARYRHTAVWTGTEMIVWGGAAPLTNTGGRYSPATNSWVATSTGASVPAARRYAESVWTGAEMIVWGGEASDSRLQNTGGRYVPATDTWTATSTGANVPAPRLLHSAVWTGTEMIVWGGQSPWFNTGGRYNPATNSWTATSTGPNVPTARYGHTTVWTGTEMIVWGGSGSVPYVNTGGRYDPATDTWTATSIESNAPAGRIGHTAVWTGTEMIVWGGGGTFPYPNTGGRYNPSTDRWTATSTGANAPTGRRNHSAVWTGKEMVVWGGRADIDFFNTGGRYTPSADTWVPTSTGANVPSGREEHTAVWTGAEMIVWGGGSPLTETGGRYAPSTDTWNATTIGAGVPSARFLHTAVWTGTEMIVWGGDPHTATGGRYCVSDCTTPGNWYQDGDADGYGIASVMVPACAQPPGFVAASGDCNDANSSIHPGVTETCNGLDDDCSGVVDDGIPAPGGRPPVNAALAGTIVTLSWPAVPGATGYDAVTGGLGDLRGSGGDFTSSTTGCLGNDLPDTTVNDVTGPPASGAGVWYLVRALNTCGGNGSYDDDGPGLQGSRDSEIAGSANSCP